MISLLALSSVSAHSGSGSLPQVVPAPVPKHKVAPRTAPGVVLDREEQG